MTDKKTILTAIKNIVTDGGKSKYSNIIKSMKLEKDSETLPYLMIKEAMSYAKTKSEEAQTNTITRDSARSSIEEILSKLSKKLLEISNKKDFEITDSFRNDINSFLAVFTQYAKFEGLNKPTEVKVDMKTTIDTSNLSIEETEALMQAISKSKITDK